MDECGGGSVDVYACVDGGTDVCADGCADKLLAGCIDECVNVSVDGSTDG